MTCCLELSTPWIRPQKVCFCTHIPSPLYLLTERSICCTFSIFNSIHYVIDRKMKSNKTLLTNLKMNHFFLIPQYSYLHIYWYLVNTLTLLWSLHNFTICDFLISTTLNNCHNCGDMNMKFQILWIFSQRNKKHLKQI